MNIPAKTIDFNEIESAYANGTTVSMIYFGTEPIWSEEEGRLELGRLGEEPAVYDVNELNEQWEANGRLYFSTGQTVDDPFRGEFPNGISSLTYVNDSQSTKNSGLSALWSLKNCTNLSAVVMPNVKNVLYQACYGCKSLRKLVLPKAEVFNNESFAGCNSLVSVIFPSVKSLGDNVFWECSNLEFAQFDGITDLSGYKTFDKSGLKTFSGQNVRTAGTAFYELTSLLSVDMPRLLSANDTFHGCLNLVSAHMPRLLSAGNSMFQACTSLHEIPNQAGLQYIGEKTFQGCESLTGASLLSVRTISSYGFAYCSAITGLEFGEDLEVIGEYAFKGDDSLRSLRFKGQHPVLCANANIPDGCIAYFDKIEDYYSAMTADGLSGMHYNVRHYPVRDSGICCLTNVVGSPYWMVYTSEKTGGVSVKYIDSSTGKPAFPYSYYLLNDGKMYLENSVTALDQLIEFHDVNTGIVDILSGCFDGCTNLSAVSFYGVNNIGESAFQDTALTYADFPNTKIIGDYAFHRCKMLSSINLPSAVKIGKLSFQNTSLQSLFLDNVIEIDQNSITELHYLKSLSMNSLKSLPRMCITGCENLLSLSLSNLTSYNAWAIMDTSNITYLDLRSLSSIDGSLFFMTKPYHITSLNVESISFQKFSEISGYIGQNFEGCSLTCSDGTYII